MRSFGAQGSGLITYTMQRAVLGGKNCALSGVKRQGCSLRAETVQCTVQEVRMRLSCLVRNFLNLAKCGINEDDVNSDKT